MPTARQSKLQMLELQELSTLGLPVLTRYSEACINSWTAVGQFRLSCNCEANIAAVNERTITPSQAIKHALILSVTESDDG